jgi:nucleoside-diphosphate-sugar epimerase
LGTFIIPNLGKMQPMRTLLIAGMGDVARRALPRLVQHWRVLVLAHHAQAAETARAGGAIPIMANLDDATSLKRLAGLADDLWITAPPPSHGMRDSRTRKLLYALAKADRIPQRISYISTTGVYGNSHGNWLDECSPPCRKPSAPGAGWMQKTPCVPLPAAMAAS